MTTSAIAKFEESISTITHAKESEERARNESWGNVIIERVVQGHGAPNLVIVRGPTYRIMHLIGRIADMGYDGLRSVKMQTLH